MSKGIIRIGTSKNIIIITGRYKNFITNTRALSVKYPKLSETPLLQIRFTQKRFCSNSSAGAIHKVFFVNAESPDANETNDTSASIDYIPPPPVPPEFTEETVEILNSLGEPTLSSLGLGGWSPIGLMQSGLELLHVSAGLPWWASIAVGTIIIRTLLFPLVIKSQRNSALMNNYLPEMQVLQEKVAEAKRSGNNYEAARASYEMQQFMMKKGLSPLKNMIVPLVQAPVFISMFIGLRRCANLPVESMKEGGMWWFTDLTIADPIFALPIFTAVTLLVTMEVGADGQQLANNSTSRLIRNGLRALPFVMFPFIINFPAAILCYWASTNFVSLLQVAFLRIPAVRAFFKINPLIKHKKKKVSLSAKGIIKDVKDSWGNMKAASSVAERQKVDEMSFKRSGVGPLVKTFKHNPVQIKAKGREQ